MTTTTKTTTTIIPLLSNHFAKEKVRFQQAFHAFLCTTQRPESPTNLLIGHVDILRMIHALASDEYPGSESCYYEAQMRMCGPSPDIAVEALYEQGGWADFNMAKSCTKDDFLSREWSGVYAFRIYKENESLNDFVDSICQQVGEQGELYPEMQLRSMWREWQRSRCRGIGLRPVFDPEEMLASETPTVGLEVYRCNGNCGILPGDTVYWRAEHPDRVVQRWEPATKEELEERGYDSMLSYMCEEVRMQPIDKDDHCSECDFEDDEVSDATSDHSDHWGSEDDGNDDDYDYFGDDDDEDETDTEHSVANEDLPLEE